MCSISINEDPDRKSGRDLFCCVGETVEFALSVVFYPCVIDRNASFCKVCSYAKLIKDQISIFQRINRENLINCPKRSTLSFCKLVIVINTEAQ